MPMTQAARARRGCYRRRAAMRFPIPPLLILPLILPLFVPAPARAQDVQAALAPPGSRVAFRTYGIGVFPIDGGFTRFSGVLRYDPATHARCRLTLRIDTASLVLPTAIEGTMARGQDFLDVARYPRMRFRGRCAGGRIVGQLTMRGVTRPFGMIAAWQGSRLIAQGRLARAAWGMTAHPFLGGRTARITVTIPLPPEPATAGPGGQ